MVEPLLSRKQTTECMCEHDVRVHTSGDTSFQRSFLFQCLLEAGIVLADITVAPFSEYGSHSFHASVPTHSQRARAPVMGDVTRGPPRDVPQA